MNKYNHLSRNLEGSINGHLFIKDSIKGEWRASNFTEVLSKIGLYGKPLSKEEKSSLPVFGFDKLPGEKSNAQQYPCKWVVLELDTPHAIKEKILNGCHRTKSIYEGKFWVWYTLFLHSADLSYYWMYMTPSMRGLRFVLQVDIPIQNEHEYEQAIKQFLRKLFYKTNGEINPAYFDIRINQAWYVPTFLEFFDDRQMVFVLKPFKQKVERKVKPVYGEKTNANYKTNTTLSLVERLEKAVKFTERKFIYVQGQRNDFIHNLACNCNRFGIQQNETYDFILGNFDLPEREISATVRSAYHNNLNEFGLFLKLKN